LQIAVLRNRLDRIPYLDPIDLRFRNRVRLPVPTAKAVMFCLMDVSGSMDESRKDPARDELAKFLRSLPPNCGKVIIVRVNGIDTRHFVRDIDAIVGPGLDIVNLPKPESPDDVRECAAALQKAERRAKVEPVDILPNIESPKALRLAADIATASTRVVGLQAGWGDLIEPLDISSPQRIQL